MLPIITLVTIELGIFLLAMLSKEELRVRNFVITNMILVSVYSALTVNFAGIYISMGTFLYVAVVAGQAGMLVKYGRQKALDTLNLTVVTMATVTILSYAVSLFPVLPGNELYGGAVHTLSDTSIRLIIASFFAFVVGQLALIEIYAHLRLGKGFNIFIAIILAQLVDCLLFFPIAFGLPPNILDIVIGGFIIKCLLSVLFLPIILKKYE